MRSRLAAVLLAVVAGFVVTGSARAEDSPVRSFSLTISPLQLVLPLAEVTGEARMGENAGFAGILGYGKVSSTDKATDTSTEFTVFEIGGSLRYYVLGDFDDGMQIGAEALYCSVSGGDKDSDVSGVGEGLSVGPFIGYKTTTDGGFTFDSQLGAAYMMITAEAKDESDGDSATASGEGFGAIVNLNIGWSF